MFPEEVREKLETIQKRYGLEAAQLATDAIKECFIDLSQAVRISQHVRFPSNRDA
ncbi:hypothetical protein KDW_18350 [Dictyobacter vulcani]|uniref:Uncharacterized protein n=1 Tax=Dictyobacter vulcani TaxID=2607529 RepID=A0A5J4KIW5_9CHLR|nr:hypothetical protein [Dictyobacter vulcani]GER87673.1 hypothetical protein KDW_18350 [Dictyobacter vulcani]